MRAHLNWDIAFARRLKSSASSEVLCIQQGGAPTQACFDQAFHTGGFRGIEDMAVLDGDAASSAQVVEGGRGQSTPKPESTEGHRWTA